MAKKAKYSRKEKSKFAKIKKSRQGSLRKATKTKKGQKIPVSKLEQMKKSSNPNTRRKATFALNARKWSHRRK
jgi:oligoendopeptidase F